MASGDVWSSSIEKLRGSENYHTWVFAMTSLLELNGLEKCILETNGETDADKIRKAKARITLNVDSAIYVHIQNAQTAADMWKMLQVLYEDKGLTRKIGLLRKLITTQLENCESMTDYVGEIIGTANKLNGIGFTINDEWLGCIMLAGLTSDFKPMIMGLESSGAKITADLIKTKLMDTVYKKPSENALLGKSNQKYQEGKKRNNDNFKCFNCGRRGHKANMCRNKSNPSTSKQNPKMHKETKNAFTAVYLTKQQHEDKSEWYIDSGASQHMTPFENWLDESKETSINEIITANDKRLSVSRAGKVTIALNNREVDIKNVLCVPQLTTNLLSVSQMVKNGNRVQFDSNGCTVLDSNNKTIINVQPVDGVYKIHAQNVKCLLTSNTTNSAMTWHRRLGHINYNDLCKMRDGIVDGIKFTDGGEEIRSCQICMEGKQTRLPFGHSENRAENVLDLIHSDLAGPMETLSIGGARYFLSFIDDHSRKMFIYFLKSKSEVLSKFREFKAYVEVQTERKIKAIRTDNGSEYCNNEFEYFLRKSGIHHQKSNTYTPQQNGIAERANRTLVERAKCMIFDAKLDKSYWAEAVNMATYVVNRSVNSMLKTQTPEEIWTGKKVDLKNLRIFGSPIMVHIPKEKRTKWDRKSQRMLFVGYSDDTKGYRCIEPITKKFQISRDVKFIENDNTSKVEMAENLDSVRDHANTSSEVEIDIKSDQEENKENLSHMTDEEEYSDETDSDSTFDPKVPITPVEQPRRTTRIPKPKNLSDYVTYSARTNETNDDPTTFEEAIGRNDSDRWKIAMDNEIQSLAENNTWELVDKPYNKKTIKCKWVFKTKYNTKGNIIRHKARLVAKGCSQKYGIDYKETYSPVVRYSSIRYLIALAVKLGLKIDQMDAVTAFLQGELFEEIYMEQPEGYIENSNKVCKLKRPIYGLKQSSREWNKKLTSKLKSFGLLKSRADPCVYFTKDKSLIVAVYVDDLLIFWKDEELKNKLKSSLNTWFKMKDMGKATNCVGINISYTEDGISLDQTKYIEDILQKFNMAECKPVKTPSDTNQKLSVNMCPKTENEIREMANVPYQEAVGSLLYLVQGTRPDLAFAVNDVSRYNNNYGKAHWKAVKRIFRYLKGTAEQKLCYSKTSENKLIGYCDADWASDVDKRRSCTGYMFKMCGGAISWASKRQATVAISSTEAEYMALSAGLQEILWLKTLMDDLDTEMRVPFEIRCDNQSAINLANNDCFRARSKHIDVRHHFIRDKIEEHVIRLQYVPTEEMIADNLTKAVTGPKNTYCTRNMGIVGIKD